MFKYYTNACYDITGMFLTMICPETWRNMSIELVELVEQGKWNQKCDFKYSDDWYEPLVFVIRFLPQYVNCT